MAALNWLRDGAEATRRRQRTLLAVAVSAIAIPATILILATVVARAGISSRPLVAETTVAGVVINASSGNPVVGATVFASTELADTQPSEILIPAATSRLPMFRRRPR